MVLTIFVKLTIQLIKEKHHTREVFGNFWNFSSWPLSWSTYRKVGEILNICCSKEETKQRRAGKLSEREAELGKRILAVLRKQSLCQVSSKLAGHIHRSATSKQDTDTGQQQASRTQTQVNSKQQPGHRLLMAKLGLS